MSEFTVTAAAERPGNVKPGQCFYCHQPIGSFHGDECVLIEKQVQVDLKLRYCVMVPAHWTAGDVEFHRNEGSWCADNLVEELQKIRDQGNEVDECLCNDAKFTFVGESSGRHLNEGGEA